MEQGKIIGNTKTVLKKDKGRPMCMLHFEMHVKGTRGGSPEWVPPDAEKPEVLLDPTSCLAPLFYSDDKEHA